MLLNEIQHVEAAADTAKRVLASLHAPITIKDQECRVTGSIGIASYPNDARDSATLMKHADMAMYLAKDEGKNNFQFYSADVTPMSVEHLELEVQLAQALQRGEFSLQYQPRVDISTGRILGAEALLRWWNADLGTMSPAQFIRSPRTPTDRSDWQVGASYGLRADMRGRRAASGIVMSVNISARQFKGHAAGRHCRRAC